MNDSSPEAVPKAVLFNALLLNLSSSSMYSDNANLWMLVAIHLRSPYLLLKTF
jgi:hypothetical protein